MALLETKFGVVAPAALDQQVWFDGRLEVLRRLESGDSLRIVARDLGKTKQAIRGSADKARRDLDALGMKPETLFAVAGE